MYAGRQNMEDIPKRVTNLEKSQKHALCRTVSEYYDKRKFFTAKKATFALR
jgi:hypothetical protein